MPPLRIQTIRGRAPILRVQPLLVELARACGQTGEADNLHYFLSTADALKKTPVLLLMHYPTAPAPTLQEPASQMGAGPRGVAGAVLLFEYRAGPFGSRVYATSDSSGRRNVLAPAGLRARLAALAATTLVEQGAHIVHVAFSVTHSDSEDGMQGDDATFAHALPLGPSVEQNILAEQARSRRTRPRNGVRWSLLERPITHFLPLADNHFNTLARIGPRSRYNLRYYRRRSERDLGCRFIPEAKISLRDFLAFNRESTYAVSDELATWRYRTWDTLAQKLFCGIQDRDGRWLSLVGGRRHHRFVEIDWQMNRADLPLYSLSTVVRAYIIEDEIRRGSKRFYLEGGTPHPITRSFVKEQVSELTVKRSSLYVRLLERFASVIFPQKNYLAQVLLNGELHWKPW